MIVIERSIFNSILESKTSPFLYRKQIWGFDPPLEEDEKRYLKLLQETVQPCLYYLHPGLASLVIVYAVSHCSTCLRLGIFTSRKENETCLECTNMYLFLSGFIATCFSCDENFVRNSFLFSFSSSVCFCLCQTCWKHWGPFLRQPYDEGAKWRLERTKTTIRLSFTDSRTNSIGTLQELSIIPKPLLSKLLTHIFSETRTWCTSK